MAFSFPVLSCHDGAIWAGDEAACTNIPDDCAYLGLGHERIPSYPGWLRRLLRVPVWQDGPLRAWWRIDRRLTSSNLEGRDLMRRSSTTLVRYLGQGGPPL